MNEADFTDMSKRGLPDSGGGRPPAAHDVQFEAIVCD